MSHFVPTGYLTIDQAIDRVVDLKSGDTGPLLTEEEAAEVLRQLLYADRVTWVTITDYGTLIETPKHICGGEQWYEVLQSGRIKFAHGHVLSNPVSGRPLIPRDALEAAFEPDRAVSEEPQPDPEPPEETQAKEPPEDPPLQRAVNKSEPPASSEPPRQQQERTAATAERNADIQRLADSIWLDAWEGNESKLLTENEVVGRMLDDKTFESRFRDHRGREGGALAWDTIVRLLSEPEWVRKERSRRKKIKPKNIPSC
jgi:hypothetical protein